MNRKTAMSIFTIFYLFGTVVALMICRSYVGATVTDMKVSGAQTYQATVPPGTTTLIVQFPGVKSGPEYLHVNISVPTHNVNGAFTLEYFDAGGFGGGGYGYTDLQFRPPFPHFQFENPGGDPLFFSISVEPEGRGANYAYVIRIIYNYHTDGWWWSGVFIISMFFASLFPIIALLVHVMRPKKGPPLYGEHKPYSRRVIILQLVTLALAAFNIYNCIKIFSFSS